MGAHVLPHRLWVGGQHADGFCGIDGAASTQSHHDVCATLAKRLHASAHVCVGGVGLHIAKHAGCDVVLLQQRDEFIGQAVAREERIGDDEGMAFAEALHMRG